MDDLRRVGHDVEVQAARRDGSRNGNEERNMSVPDRRIGVKTDVVVETSERLPYNDRLY